MRPRLFIFMELARGQRCRDTRTSVDVVSGTSTIRCTVAVSIAAEDPASTGLNGAPGPLGEPISLRLSSLIGLAGRRLSSAVDGRLNSNCFNSSTRLVYVTLIASSFFLSTSVELRSITCCSKRHASFSCEGASGPGLIYRLLILGRIPRRNAIIDPKVVLRVGALRRRGSDGLGSGRRLGGNAVKEFMGWLMHIGLTRRWWSSVRTRPWLLLRLKSCGTRSRPTRSAVKALSLGLCDLIGTADALAPVLDELSEPVRLMVDTEDDDKEFEREDRRAWCCVRAEAGDTLLPPLLGTETEVDGPCIITLQSFAAETALCRRRLCARSTLCRLMRQQLTANHVLRASARSDAPEPFDTAWAMYDGRRPTCLIASAVGQWDSGYLMRPSVHPLLSISHVLCAVPYQMRPSIQKRTDWPLVQPTLSTTTRPPVRSNVGRRRRGARARAMVQGPGTNIKQQLMDPYQGDRTSSVQLPACFRMRVVYLRERSEDVSFAATAKHDYHLLRRLRSPALRVAETAIPIQGRDDRGQQSTRGRLYDKVPTQVLRYRYATYQRCGASRTLEHALSALFEIARIARVRSLDRLTHTRPRAAPTPDPVALGTCIAVHRKELLQRAFADHRPRQPMAKFVSGKYDAGRTRSALITRGRIMSAIDNHRCLIYPRQPYHFPHSGVRCTCHVRLRRS
ncbi:hypothetical protein KC345_g297 [Hortaea werneckii]|nr:hypothetical protein KC345_g297 [Hortaea werneckii]